MMKRPVVFLVFLLLAVSLAVASPAVADPVKKPAGSPDVEAARALFAANLQAIRDKNVDAYLACYLDSDSLVRTGPDGPKLGFKDLAANAGQGWPDHIEADDIHLTPVRPGLVYGTYRYRVRYGAREDAGLSERFFVQTPKGWKIAVSTAFSTLPGVPPAPRALVGATLVDGTGAAPVPDAVVLIRDGKIDCAGSRAACPVPAGVDTTDVGGQWLTPGLIDAHVHFSQTGWADGRPDGLDVRDRHPYEEVEGDLRRHPERFGHTWLCTGVTSVFDVGGYPWTFRLPGWAEPLSDEPRIKTAGPLLSTLDHWLNLAGERQFLYLKDEDTARAAVRYLADSGAGAIKVWYIEVKDRKPEDVFATVRAGGEEAAKLGLPLIVHSTELVTAKAALRAGAKLLVHSVWDAPIDDEFLALVKKNNAIYCPTLTVGRGYVRMYEGAATHKVPAVDDPNHCVDPQTLKKVAETAGVKVDIPADRLPLIDARTTKEEQIAAANLKKVQDAGITIAMGTDAGNPLTLHGPSVYGEMEAMQAAGLTPMQVLVSATHGGSLAMGRDKEIGTVEKGKLADLLLLGADPTKDVKAFRQVRSVIRGGVIRSISELSALATTEAK
ncbi:MAG TPA: amidohydrolase family protein [Thermoanaerobaculia bacterium]|jgi:imidazolonepropionase-like amidohydrolase|nr:amidohydrolase family protein [Thermoanaerobaculia bacterium]